MIEASISFQSAVRARLISDLTVTALVNPGSIRSGLASVAQMPSIIFSGGQTEFLGRASGWQLIARVYLDAHIWAVEDGADTAQAIGFAVAKALFDAPTSPEFQVEPDRAAWKRPQVIYMRDPQPEKNFTHGVVSLEAVIRWRQE